MQAALWRRAHLDTETAASCSRAAAERHLSPKAFDLLLLLVESRPRALSKGELHERLWPATFVSDATVTSLLPSTMCGGGREGAGWTFRPDGAPVWLCLQRHGDRTDTARAVARRPRPMLDCWATGKPVPARYGDHLLGRDADVAVWLAIAHRLAASCAASCPRRRCNDRGSAKARTARSARGERLAAPAGAH